MQPDEPRFQVVPGNISECLNGNGSGQFSATAGFTEAAVGTRAISQEEKRRILKERAKRLAKPQSGDETQARGLEVIVFRLAEERYAIEVKHVREVYPLRDLTPLPCTPSFVIGIINVRGQVISVVDVKEFFDLSGKGPTDLSKVLIIKNHSVEFGIISDEVVGEQRIPLNRIQSDMPALRGVREEYVLGVTHDPVVILDAERLLSDDRIIIHNEVGD